MDLKLKRGLGSNFDAYYELKKKKGIEIFGGYNMSKEEIKAENEEPGFDPENMIALLTDEESGKIYGNCEVRAYHDPPVRLYGFGYTVPEIRGKGYGTKLVTENEKIAQLYVSRCPEDAKIVLQQFSMLDDAKKLLEDSGYTHTRDSLVMALSLDEKPEDPVWPEGITVKSLADGVSITEFARINQIAFADHRGAVDEPLEKAIERWEYMVETSQRVYDPRMYSVAYDGEDPVGIVASWTEDEDDPNRTYVQSLGVVPHFRKKGLGLALLRYAFVQAYNLGKTGVALSVDGSSLTGADRLYTRAGMYIQERIGVYEKEIRAGKEISKQS